MYVLCVCSVISHIKDERDTEGVVRCALSRYILPARPEARVKLTFSDASGLMKGKRSKAHIEGKMCTFISHKTAKQK